MEVYNVTVWDVNRNYKDPEGWTMESPPVRVKATDSYEAAGVVATRGGITNLEGLQRPEGFRIGMFFKDRGGYEGLVFQVEDLNIVRPYWDRR